MYDATKLYAMLEAAVDAHGIEGVANMLAGVAYDKAAHLRDNWQDPGTAKLWDRIAGRLETLETCNAVKAASPRPRR